MLGNQNWVQICTEYFKICTHFVEMLLFCCSWRFLKPTTSYRWTGWVWEITGVWSPLFQGVLCVVVSLTGRIWWFRSQLLWVADGDVNNCSMKSYRSFYRFVVASLCTSHSDLTHEVASTFIVMFDAWPGVSRGVFTGHRFSYYPSSCRIGTLRSCYRYLVCHLNL